MTARYALYYAPAPDSLLWRLACAWHGRDPAGDGEAMAVEACGLDGERHAKIVQSAAHYGFHATLKAPISLKETCTEDGLIDSLCAFTARRAAFRSPSLRVGRIGGFLALVLSGGSAPFDALAADLVRGFDDFRQPETEEEVARRRSVHLTTRQETNLVRWGYPYVFDDHQFHMTLTTWLDEPELSDVEARLKAYFRPVTAMPLWVDRIALFKQETRKDPFVRLRDFPLGSKGAA